MSVLLAWTLLVTAPATEGGDTIWEEIESSSGVLLSDDEIDAVKELADERFDEQRFLGAGALHKEPDLALYTDPVGALAFDPLHLSEIEPSDFDIPVEVEAVFEVMSPACTDTLATASVRGPPSCNPPVTLL